MGSASSKFKKYLQHGDEFAAMQVNKLLIFNSVKHEDYVSYYNFMQLNKK